MSWFARLVETYDACAGQEQFASDPLTPVGSLPQTTQLHVRLWEDGSFFTAELSEHKNTVMFVTEDSAARSGTAPEANPLTEQLEYCASGIERFGGKKTKYERYLKILRQWVKSGMADAKVAAILTYVEAGTFIDDLLRERVLTCEADQLAKVKVGEGGKKDPMKLWVRWSVLNYGLQSETWTDKALAASWARFEGSSADKRNVCMFAGEKARTTQKHPKRIRNSGDNCKLISTNDKSGFTFRGRFEVGSQALTIGYDATQKAHNALRWLISRQGAREGDQVIVAWELHGKPTPPLLDNSASFFVGEASRSAGYGGDAGQAFSLRLRQAVNGYRAVLGSRAQMAVMALDSATDGRVAVLYYRELWSSELLDRVEAWHVRLAWLQDFGFEGSFVGAPAPLEIIRAAYGKKTRSRGEVRFQVDDSLLRAEINGLLPCIVDGSPLPRHLLRAAVARTIRLGALRTSCARQPAKMSLEELEFERSLGVTCSLFSGWHFSKEYTMALEEDRTSRDYLYGRLLAVADNLEGLALWQAEERRQTNAATYMQRFADYPFRAWPQIRKALIPYAASLRKRSKGFAAVVARHEMLMDEIHAKFQPGDFANDSRLSGEFLLGYHCQREALRPKKNSQTQEEPEGETSELVEQD